MKKAFFCFISISLLFLFCSQAVARVANKKVSLLSNSKQMILVVTKDWNSIQGYLYTFHRSSARSKWTRAKISSPVVLGKNGMGWGIGYENFDGPKKAEGDFRSPAGIFTLTTTFGFQKVGHFSVSIPYKQINPQTICVDDTSSRYYGEIFDATRHIHKDWNSAEQMSEYKEYKWGVLVNYNIGHKKLNKGSCIFLHEWDGFMITTAGCTAMPEKIIKEIVFWLNIKDKPVFVQMPLKEYEIFAQQNGLPHL